MVTGLLTKEIKLDISLSNHIDQRGPKMKKIDARRGFWDWVLGGGWSGGGSNG